METPFEKGRWYTWPSPFHRSEDRSLLRPLLPWNAFSFAWPVRNRHRFDIPSRRTFRISRSTRLHIRSIRTEPNDFIPLLKFSSGFDSQLWFLATIVLNTLRRVGRRFKIITSLRNEKQFHFQMVSHFLKIIYRSRISPFLKHSSLNLNLIFII